MCSSKIACQNNIVISSWLTSYSWLDSARAGWQHQRAADKLFVIVSRVSPVYYKAYKEAKIMNQNHNRTLRLLKNTWEIKINKLMNERTIEPTIARSKDRHNERTRKQTKDRKTKRTNEQTDEKANERTNERIIVLACSLFQSPAVFTWLWLLKLFFFQ